MNEEIIQMERVIRIQYRGAIVAAAAWALASAFLGYRAFTCHMGWGLLACLAGWSAVHVFKKARADRVSRGAALYLYALQEVFKLPKMKLGCEEEVRNLYAELLMRDNEKMLEGNAKSIAAQMGMERILGRYGKQMRESNPELFEEEE